MVSFSVQIVSKFGAGNSLIVFTTLDSNFALLGAKAVEVGSLALNQIFFLKDTVSFLRGLGSVEPDHNLSVCLFESRTVNGQFGFACERTDCRLDVGDSIWRACYASDRKHPHIVHPVVGPATKNVELLVLSIVEGCGGLSGLGDHLVFLQLNRNPVLVVNIKVPCVIHVLAASSVASFEEAAAASAEDEIFPRGDGRGKTSIQIPLGVLMSGFDVLPGLLLDVINEHVAEL